MKRSLFLILAFAWLLAWIGPVNAQATNAPDDLATLHEEVGKLDCRDCHGAVKPESVTPEEALRTANQQCMACHGTTANVAAKITPRLANRHINPHAGHVVSIECVTCHSGHEKSQAYCSNCHAFDMPMTLGKTQKSR